jgi:hypothetical protein
MFVLVPTNSLSIEPTKLLRSILPESLTQPLLCLTIASFLSVVTAIIREGRSNTIKSTWGAGVGFGNLDTVLPSFLTDGGFSRGLEKMFRK